MLTYGNRSDSGLIFSDLQNSLINSNKLFVDSFEFLTFSIILSVNNDSFVSLKFPFFQRVEVLGSQPKAEGVLTSFLTLMGLELYFCLLSYSDCGSCFSLCSSASQLPLSVRQM